MKRVYISGLWFCVGSALLLLGAPRIGSTQDFPTDLTTNEQVVVNWIREVFQAKNAAAIFRFYAPNMIQHNPEVPGGAQGFYNYFRKKWEAIGPKPVKPYLNPEPYLMIAQRDLVLVVNKAMSPDPEHAGRTYTRFWFDLYRVRNGKIVEHWDPTVKGVPNP